jgi:hypothetical protein
MRLMLQCLGMIVLVGLFLSPAQSASRAVPLEDYVKTAESIVLGTVVAVEETGERLKIKRGNVNVDYPFVRAVVRVTQMIKGPKELEEVVLHATDSTGNPPMVMDQQSVFFIYKEQHAGPWKGKRTATQVEIREGMAEPVNISIKGQPPQQTLEEFLSKIDKILHRK